MSRVQEAYKEWSEGKNILSRATKAAARRGFEAGWALALAAAEGAIDDVSADTSPGWSRRSPGVRAAREAIQKLARGEEVAS